MSIPKATSFHSGHILVLAERAYQRSHESSTEAEVSIILAAVAIEGFLNEIAHFATHFDDSPSTVAMGKMLGLAEDNNAQPKLKLHIIHFALTGCPLGNDTPVAQDFDALLSLRNGLAHVKPISFDWDFTAGFTAKPIDDYPKAIRHLVKAGVIAIPPSRPHTWRYLVDDLKVARWACNVVVNTMQAIVKWSPDGNFAQHMQFMTNDLNLLTEDHRAKA